MNRLGKLLTKATAAMALVCGVAVSSATVFDATILINKAINSPTLTVRYSGQAASMAELIVNGESYGTRSLNGTVTSGETSFNINLYLLREGDNDVEVRLLDKNGRIVGTQRSVVQAENPEKPTVFLSAPRMGATVEGPVEIKVGFGRELKNIYVSFFVDNQVRTFINQPPYSYMWDTMRERNGWHEIEAWVSDESGSTFKSKKLKIFVENAGGRTPRRIKTITPLPNLDPAAAAVKQPIPIVATTAVAATTTKATATKTRKVVKATKAPKVFTPVALNSLIRADLVPMSDNPMSMRPTSMDHSVMMGDRLMTPTGTRSLRKVAAPQTPKVAQKVETTGSAPMVNKVSPKVTTTPVVQPKATRTELEIKPTVVPTTPSVKPIAKPIVKETVKEAEKIELNPAGNGDSANVSGATLLNRVASLPKSELIDRPLSSLAPTGKVVLPAPTRIEQPAPATTKLNIPVAAAPSGVFTRPKTTAKVPAVVTTLIKIAKGTKIPKTGTFAVVMDNQLIEFDVQPHFESGVPVAPVRHIIEKKGGKLGWNNAEKKVHAELADKDIFIQIGTRVANVNGAVLNMELPAVIEKGRTIVPLSFLRDAFGINIEYDKLTGHVLITSVQN